ncbi:hypothetical protein L218DRAFT_985215 [Marasmius fiardii PR-910]|nr:hypothetical protein L218DRAFT_985215 [Marasmius fiardii PR-910]
MSSGSSQIFDKLKAGTLRDALRDLGHKKWGNLTRSEMLVELKKMVGEDETYDDDEPPATSKSKSTAKPRKSLSAPGTSQKRKPVQSSEETDSISAAPATRGSRRKAEEIAAETTRTTRSRAVISQPPLGVTEKSLNTSKRKRGQPSPADSEEEDREESDKEDVKQPAKRTRQTTTVSSSRNQRSQDQPSTRSTRSHVGIVSESISFPVPRTTRTSVAKRESPVRANRNTRRNGATMESISSPSRLTRSRAADMDVDEFSITRRSHAADSSPVRTTRTRSQHSEPQFLARTGSRNKTYVSREAREARRRSRSAASASEVEADSDGVDDADVPVPSSGEDEEEAAVGEEEEEEEEEKTRTSRKRGKGRARAASLPEPQPKRARGRSRKAKPAQADSLAPEPKRGRARPNVDPPAPSRSFSQEVATPSRPGRNRSIKRPNPYPTYASPVAAKDRSENVVLGRNKKERGGGRPSARGRPSVNGSHAKRSAVADNGKRKQEVRHKFDGVEVPSLPYKIQATGKGDEEVDGEYDLDPDHVHETGGRVRGDKTRAKRGEGSSQGDKPRNEPEKSNHVENGDETSDGEWTLSLADKVITSNGIRSRDEQAQASQSGETLQPVAQADNDEEMKDPPYEFAIPQPRPETEEPGSERDVRDEDTDTGAGVDLDADAHAADTPVEPEESAVKEIVVESVVENHSEVPETVKTDEGIAEKENQQGEEEVEVPPVHAGMVVDDAVAGTPTSNLVVDGELPVPPVETEIEQKLQEPENQQQMADEPQDQGVEDSQEIATNVNTPDKQVAEQAEDESQPQIPKEIQDATTVDTIGDEIEDQVEEMLQAQTQAAKENQEVEPAHVDTSETAAPQDVQEDTGENGQAIVTGVITEEQEAQRFTEFVPSDSEIFGDEPQVSTPAGLDLAALHSRPDPEEDEPEIDLGEEEPTSDTPRYEPLPTTIPSFNVMPSLSDLHSRPEPGEEEDYGDDDNEEPNSQSFETVNTTSVAEEAGSRAAEVYDLEVEYEEAEISQVPSAGATPEAFNGLGPEPLVEHEERGSDADLDEMMNIEASASASVDGGDGTARFDFSAASVGEGTTGIGAGQGVLVDDDGSMYLNEDAFAMDTEETSMAGVGASHIGNSSSLEVLPQVSRITAAITTTTTTTTPGSYA